MVVVALHWNILNSLILDQGSTLLIWAFSVLCGRLCQNLKNAKLQQLN